jgi:hypothetical protein
LSLFNNLIILKKIIPAKIFGRCEFGLTAKDNMDCIYCDRCRYYLKSSLPLIKPERTSGLTARFLLIIVLIFGLFVSVIYIDKFHHTIPSPTEPGFRHIFGRPFDFAGAGSAAGRRYSAGSHSD